MAGPCWLCAFNLDKTDSVPGIWTVQTEGAAQQRRASPVALQQGKWREGRTVKKRWSRKRQPKRVAFFSTIRLCVDTVSASWHKGSFIHHHLCESSGEKGFFWHGSSAVIAVGTQAAEEISGFTRVCQKEFFPACGTGRTCSSDCLALFFWFFLWNVLVTRAILMHRALDGGSVPCRWGWLHTAQSQNDVWGQAIEFPAITGLWVLVMPPALPTLCFIINSNVGSCTNLSKVQNQQSVDDVQHPGIGRIKWSVSIFLSAVKPMLHIKYEPHVKALHVHVSGFVWNVELGTSFHNKVLQVPLVLCLYLEKPVASIFYVCISSVQSPQRDGVVKMESLFCLL